jgi:hypothetical protein
VKIPYVGAPRECKGKWVADEQVTFGTPDDVFADAGTASATTSAPCKK